MAIASAAILSSIASPFIASATAPSPEVPAPVTLAWCLERAREANPNLERVAAIASAARQRIVPAGALEDPRFAYEASNVPTGDFDFSSTPLSGHQLGLRQKLRYRCALTDLPYDGRHGR